MNLESQYNLVVIEGRATYERIISGLRDSEPEEAIRNLQNFLKIYPEFAQAHNDLAVYYYQMGNSLKALAHYEKAHKLAPKNTTFLKNLADFYMVELEWSDDAIQIYLGILKDNPFDVEVLNSLGAISQKIGRKEQARQYFGRALQLDPASLDARVGLQFLEQGPVSQIAMQKEQTKPQIMPNIIPNISQTLEAPVKTEQTQSPEECYRAAIATAGEGKREEAIRMLEELTVRSPGHAAAHNDLGVLYQQAGDLDSALKHQELAATLSPATATYQKNLADLLFIGFGEYEKALTIYVGVLSKTPRDVEVLKAISHVCIVINQFDNAAHFLKQILVIQPWDQEARAALKQIEDNKIAEVAQNEAVTVSPEDMYAQFQALLKEDKNDDARSLLEQLTQLHPGFAVAHNDLGVLRYHAGDVQGARSCYERAVELEPTNIPFRKNLADLYFVELGMSDEAIAIYLDLLKQQPRNVETLENLGHICKALGQTDEAKTFYRRVLEIEPWNAGVREELQTLF